MSSSIGIGRLLLLVADYTMQVAPGVPNLRGHGAERVCAGMPDRDLHRALRSVPVDRALIELEAEAGRGRHQEVAVDGLRHGFP